MFEGSRVTDAVSFHRRRGEMRGAVRVVRQRTPERFRWKSAVAGVNQVAGKLRGLERMRIEEPVRELVLELPDETLRREVILDARKVGVDLDRGEVLPRLTLADLRHLSVLAGVDVGRIARYTKLPVDVAEPVDTAACVVIGRALSKHYLDRAHKLWLSVPDPEGPEPLRQHHRYMLERADQDRAESERWASLSKSILDSGRSQVDPS